MKVKAKEKIAVIILALLLTTPTFEMNAVLENDLEYMQPIDSEVTQLSQTTSKSNQISQEELDSDAKNFLKNYSKKLKVLRKLIAEKQESINIDTPEFLACNDKVEFLEQLLPKQSMKLHKGYINLKRVFQKTESKAERIRKTEPLEKKNTEHLEKIEKKIEKLIERERSLIRGYSVQEFELKKQEVELLLQIEYFEKMKKKAKKKREKTNSIIFKKELKFEELTKKVKSTKIEYDEKYSDLVIEKSRDPVKEFKMFKKQRKCFSEITKISKVILFKELEILRTLSKEIKKTVTTTRVKITKREIKIKKIRKNLRKFMMTKLKLKLKKKSPEVKQLIKVVNHRIKKLKRKITGEILKIVKLEKSIQDNIETKRNSIFLKELKSRLKYFEDKNSIDRVKRELEKIEKMFTVSHRRLLTTRDIMSVHLRKNHKSLFDSATKKRKNMKHNLFSGIGKKNKKKKQFTGMKNIFGSVRRKKHKKKKSLFGSIFSKKKKKHRKKKHNLFSNIFSAGEKKKKKSRGKKHNLFSGLKKKSRKKKKHNLFDAMKKMKKKKRKKIKNLFSFMKKEEKHIFHVAKKKRKRRKKKNSIFGKILKKKKKHRKSKNSIFENIMKKKAKKKRVHHHKKVHSIFGLDDILKVKKKKHHHHKKKKKSSIFGFEKKKKKRHHHHKKKKKSSIFGFEKEKKKKHHHRRKKKHKSSIFGFEKKKKKHHHRKRHHHKKSSIFGFEKKKIHKHHHRKHKKKSSIFGFEKKKKKRHHHHKKKKKSSIFGFEKKKKRHHHHKKRKKSSIFGFEKKKIHRKHHKRHHGKHKQSIFGKTEKKVETKFQKIIHKIELKAKRDLARKLKIEKEKRKNNRAFKDFKHMPKLPKINDKESAKKNACERLRIINSVEMAHKVEEDKSITISDHESDIKMHKMIIRHASNPLYTHRHQGIFKVVMIANLKDYLVQHSLLPSFLKNGYEMEVIDTLNIVVGRWMERKKIKMGKIKFGVWIGKMLIKMEGLGLIEDPKSVRCAELVSLIRGLPILDGEAVSLQEMVQNKE